MFALSIARRCVGTAGVEGKPYVRHARRSAGSIAECRRGRAARADMRRCDMSGADHGRVRYAAHHRSRVIAEESPSMARGVNKVILVGNLGADPETRYTANGGAITNIRLATSENWKDKQTGENQERTEWHRVVLFGKLGEIAGE